MNTIDEMKQSWAALMAPPLFDETSMRKLIKARISRHTRGAYNYFWGSFVVQIIFYSLMAHLIVRFWNTDIIILTAVCGVVLFIPFTVVLMSKFKKMAVAPLSGIGNASVHTYLQSQRTQLKDILKFKVRYEMVLVPLINAVGIIIPLAIYWPAHWNEKFLPGIVLYVITLIVSFIAMRSENQKCFRHPIYRLDQILKEYNPTDV